eukprot:TRINITY_DN8958_c0_g1_i1.p1 TRINITY_DN8958_c0_g1~~TRINITY_DN8958_c0_g1_i1.p1  ORF type:complete len:631 (+),score=103.19 TRINITY_DN8958_c0_g1_i1:28-1920(+)
MRRGLLTLILGCAGALGAATTTVTVGTTVLRTSRTTTTLQVVSNPILDRTFRTPTGVINNPIHDAAFESLANLGADIVRYVPWFPYPHVSVAELDKPSQGKPTSWNFTYISPMFDDFMRATYGKNHTTLINFSTQPCWLYNSPDCSYPADPDQSDFSYVRGDKLLDPTATDLAAYYGRLLSWIVNGEFTDENGVLHTGGPKYKLTHWEVFNEAEHQYTKEWYTHDYDVVVSKIREEVDPNHEMKFVGIGGADPGWIPYFLNRSNHKVADIPLDYVSIHYYATGCRNRTDPSTYSDAFFGGSTEGFINMIRDTVIPARDALSPTTQLDLDELGVIMPDDNNANLPIDADLPDLYWNAAGAMYAYLFARFAPLGVEVLGHSQLAGSPKIPDWGIPLPQYPSVSLLDWRSGYGNARYWALKILIDNFAPGDEILNTTAVYQGTTPSTNPFCGEVAGPDYGQVELSCADKGSVIDEITFADWGTPSGGCQSYKPSNCSSADKALAWARQNCQGKSQCTLAPYPALGDPCYDVVKRFVVQAHCTGANGGFAVNGTMGAPVAAQAFRRNGKTKVLLINKLMMPQTVDVVGLSAGATMFVVDPTTVTRGNPYGIGKQTTQGPSVVLQPWAVVVVQLN